MNRATKWMVASVAALVLIAPACLADDPDPVGDAMAGLEEQAVAGELQPGDTMIFTGDEFSFTPEEVRAAPGHYNATFTNVGEIRHDITFEDGTTVVADPGETVEFELDVPPDGLSYICEIPGHADSGMVGRIVTGNESEEVELVVAEGSEAVAVVEPDPAAPPYRRADPQAPARGEGPGMTLIEGGADDGGDLIEVELVMTERLMTVAEGYEQKVWTFGDTVPGPPIRTRVGDTVRVRLVNPIENELSHSIDFHASQVAWNDEMRSIAPGEELIYEFTTDYAGVWMYHCGTDPVLHHIANGMFGMVITEPASGLAPIDNEFVLVQNEWYLGEQGAVSSLAKANVGAPSPDLIMFNGVAFQYLDDPIEVPTGERVRLFVLNVGPSIDSSFHIVGTIFDTVIKEGVALTRGNEGSWGSQAVDLAPAQGAIIELETAEDGLYPIVTHAFNFPGRGALGLLKSGDGEP